MKATKFALVLSGGGFKGAFQVGALQYLQEHWAEFAPQHNHFHFDIVAGVSVGALNGLLVASDAMPQLVQLWDDVGRNGVEEIYTSDFIDTRSKADTVKFKVDPEKLQARLLPNVSLNISVWKGIQLLLSKKQQKNFISELFKQIGIDFSKNFKNFRSLADNTPLREKLKTLARRANIRNCIYKCGFVSLNDGRYHAARHTDFASDEDFQKGVLASTVMPIVWESVDKIHMREGTALQAVDGGIKNVSPLGDVIAEVNRDSSGTEYIIVIINCNSGEVEPGSFEQANIAQIALRSLSDISITEIFNNDLREFIRINDLVEQFNERTKGQAVEPLQNYDFKARQRTGQPLRSFKTVIIQPDTGILGDTLTANETLIARRKEHGRQKAAEAIAQIKAAGGFNKCIIT